MTFKNVATRIGIGTIALAAAGTIVGTTAATATTTEASYSSASSSPARGAYDLPP